MEVKYLLAKQLKEKFAEYKNITVDDFYDFYKSHNENISRSSTRSYISELKKNNIIEKVSRGKYKLSDTKASHNYYFVLNIDFIDSRDIANFDVVLKQKVQDVNNLIQSVYQVDRAYSISRGDEIQLFLRYDEVVFDILLLTMAIMHPLKFRYGMSIGTFDGELKDNSYDMNGKILWRSRDAIEGVKNKSTISSNVKTAKEDFNTMANAMFELVNLLLDKITSKQWEVIKHILMEWDLKTIASELDITESSVYDRINKSGIKSIRASLRTLYLTSIKEDLS